MQPTESINDIFVIVIDETYDGDDEEWEYASESYRIALEEEFGAPFREANVGPGADLPAFINTIATASVPLWSLLVATFFLGKPINENLSAWIDLGRKIRSFFGRPVLLARHGAAVVAVEAVFSEMGGMPKTVRLLSYRPAHIGDPEELEIYDRSSEISENAPTINLGFVRHIFEIEADGQPFRVSIYGKVAKTIRL